MTAFRSAFPILAVDDVAGAVAFFSSVFGFRSTYSWEEDRKMVYAFLELEPFGIGVAARRDGEPDFALWIYADDVDEAAALLRTAGAEEVLTPTDQPCGERMCTFRDPNGYLVHVGASAAS